MKLKDLRSIFINSNGIQDININTNPAPTQGNQTPLMIFGNLIAFRKGVINLEQSDLFKKEISEFKNGILFSTSDDQIRVVIPEANSLVNKVNNFKSVVNSFHTVLDQIVGEAKDNIISIKFPQTNDLDDLAKAANDLHIIFSQVIINDKIEGQIKIDNVESGSIWIDIFVGSLLAVRLIGQLTWSAAVVYKKIQEGRIVEKFVNALNVKNDSLEDMRQKQKDQLALLVELEANHLYDDNFDSSKKDSEQIERLKNSIKLLAELIDKGAEVHPSLNVPEQVSNLFPKMENILTIESQIKKLSQ